MLKKMISCCASLGAGVVMLVGIGVGRGIGETTGYAVTGVAMNTALFDDIKVLLEIGIRRMYIPLIVAFVFAIILLIISKICCIRCNPCYDKCRGRTLTCILSSIGAAAAILGVIGSAIGIGNATVSTLIASTINPGAVAEINVLLNIGIRAIYMPIGASIIIAVGIILCLICSCCQR